MINFPVTRQKLLAVWAQPEHDALLFPNGGTVLNPDAYIPTMKVGNIILETAPARLTNCDDGHLPRRSREITAHVNGVKYRFRVSDAIQGHGRNFYCEDFKGSPLTHSHRHRVTFDDFTETIVPNALPQPHSRVCLSKGPKFIEYPRSSGPDGHKTWAHFIRANDNDWKGGIIKNIVREDPEWLPCGVVAIRNKTKRKKKKELA